MSRHAAAWRHRGVAVAALAVALVAVLVLGYLGVRGWGARSVAAVTPLDSLTIALSTTPHAGLPHLAAAKGYFADEGLAVTVIPVSHGKAAMDLLAQGKTDLAAAAEVPFVIAVLKGEAIGVAATVLSVSTEMAVVARRDRGITAARDLVGKRVGVTLGTSGDYFLWAFLVRHRIAPDSVTLVDLAPGRMVQALTDGAVDAISTWQPIRSNALSALGNQGLSLTADSAYAVTHVVVGRSDFLKARPRTIEKLVRAMVKAEQFIRAEPEQALKLAAERLKTDVASLRPVWTDLSFKVDLRQSQLITLEDEARWAMARGYAGQGPVPNFLPHLYLDALLAVQPDRVSVVR